MAVAVQPAVRLAAALRPEELQAGLEDEVVDFRIDLEMGRGILSASEEIVARRAEGEKSARYRCSLVAGRCISSNWVMEL